jgi:hypothetical protein
VIFLRCIALEIASGSLALLRDKTPAGQAEASRPIRIRSRSGRVDSSERLGYSHDMAKDDTAAPDAVAEELKAAIWQYTGWAVLLTSVFACGWALGYLMWGDAPNLRAQVQEQSQQIQAVRSERENLNYEISRLQRASERLQRELDTAKTAAAPPAGAATPAAGGASSPGR